MKKKYYIIVGIIILSIIGSLFNSDYEKKKKIKELNKTITEQKDTIAKKDQTISNLKTALTLNVTNGSIAINNSDGSSITASGDSIGVDSDMTSNSNSNSTTNMSSTSNINSTSSKVEEESIKKGLKKFHVALGRNFLGENDFYYLNMGFKLFKLPLTGMDIYLNTNIESDFKTGYVFGAGVQVFY